MAINKHIKYVYKHMHIVYACSCMYKISYGLQINLQTVYYPHLIQKEIPLELKFT